jgi:hypothetical protein
MKASTRRAISDLDWGMQWTGFSDNGNSSHFLSTFVTWSLNQA